MGEFKMQKEKTIKELNVEELPFTHTVFDKNNKEPKILILGTRITDVSIEAGYYYLGTNENVFWPILSHCFNDKNFISNDVNKIITALNRHNIVVSDLIYKCEYTGSEDINTVKGSEETNLDDLLSLVKSADYILLNGGYDSKGKGTLNYFYKFLSKYIDKNSINNKKHVGESGLLSFDSDMKTPYLSLISTSNNASNLNNTYKGKNYKDKKEAWKGEIESFIFKK